MEFKKIEKAGQRNINNFLNECGIQTKLSTTPLYKVIKTSPY